jgi:hypothetical protein
MLIRGETESGTARYHVMVVAEDTEIKYLLDYPRRLYAVGDILPLNVKLLEVEKPVFKVNDIVLEMKTPRVSIAELMGKYSVSAYELQERFVRGGRGTIPPEADLKIKLAALALDPRFREMIRPQKKLYSLKAGNLDCRLDGKEMILPIKLDLPGLCSMKVTLMSEIPGSGIIQRTEIVSVWVGPGEADPKHTTVTTVQTPGEKPSRTRLYLTPRNHYEQLLGPGFSHEIKVLADKKAIECNIIDQMDGTYRIELPPVKGERSLVIMVKDKRIWQSSAKKPER